MQHRRAGEGLTATNALSHNLLVPAWELLPVLQQRARTKWQSGWCKKVTPASGSLKNLVRNHDKILGPQLGGRFYIVAWYSHVKLACPSAAFLLLELHCQCKRQSYAWADLKLSIRGPAIYSCYKTKKPRSFICVIGGWSSLSWCSGCMYICYKKLLLYISPRARFCGAPSVGRTYLCVFNDTEWLFKEFKNRRKGRDFCHITDFFFFSFMKASTLNPPKVPLKCQDDVRYLRPTLLGCSWLHCPWPE